MFITIEEMIDVLQTKGKGAAVFGVVTTRTYPKLNQCSRKNGIACPFPMGVYKLAERSVCFGAIYSNSVNNQREKENKKTNFQSRGLWKSAKYPEGAGQRDTAYTFVHIGSGKKYFALRPITNEDNYPIILQEKYYSCKDNKEVQHFRLVDYLPIKKEEKEQSTSSQGLINEIYWKIVEIDNVVQIRTFEEIYDII